MESEPEEPQTKKISDGLDVKRLDTANPEQLQKLKQHIKQRDQEMRKDIETIRETGIKTKQSKNTLDFIINSGINQLERAKEDQAGQFYSKECRHYYSHTSLTETQTN
jgi:septal ring factor EnvC (AmiA/AmiB activator)